MKKLKEKLFIILFSISLLVNIRQCSDSQTHEDDINVLEYEIIELNSKIIKINKENKKPQEIKKPAVEVKVVKKIKQRVKTPEPIDSTESIYLIDSISNVKLVDSLIIN